MIASAARKTRPPARMVMYRVTFKQEATDGQYRFYHRADQAEPRASVEASSGSRSLSAIGMQVQGPMSGPGDHGRVVHPADHPRQPFLRGRPAYGGSPLQRSGVLRRADAAAAGGVADLV